MSQVAASNGVPAQQDSPASVRSYGHTPWSAIKMGLDILIFNSSTSEVRFRLSVFSFLPNSSSLSSLGRASRVSRRPEQEQQFLHTAISQTYHP